MKIKDLVSAAAEYPEIYDLTVYVGWSEVKGIRHHDKAAHPFVELVLEKDDGTTSRNH